MDVTLIDFNYQILKYDCTLTHQCISVFQLKNVGFYFPWDKMWEVWRLQSESIPENAGAMNSFWGLVQLHETL